VAYTGPEEAGNCLPLSTNKPQTPMPDQGLVGCTKVYVKNDSYGGAGAFAACDIKEGEVVEYGIVRVLTNVDGNVNPCAQLQPSRRQPLCPTHTRVSG
jgi:hypothetical protein